MHHPRHCPSMPKSTIKRRVREPCPEPQQVSIFLHTMLLHSALHIGCGIPLMMHQLSMRASAFAAGSSRRSWEESRRHFHPSFSIFHEVAHPRFLVSQIADCRRAGSSVSTALNNEVGSTISCGLHFMAGARPRYFFRRGPDHCHRLPDCAVSILYRPHC